MRLSISYKKMHLRLRPFLLLLPLLLIATAPRADTVEEINAKSLNILVYLKNQVEGSEAFLKQAAGVLIFPDIVKVGFGLGGEYGEGVLLVDGKPDGYYSTAGASFGLQLGAEFKSELIVFMTEEALRDFRARRGFEVGVDGHVAMVAPGSVGKMLAGDLDEEVVGFVLTNEGLMANLTLVGSKITRLAR